MHYYACVTKTPTATSKALLQLGLQVRLLSTKFPDKTLNDALGARQVLHPYAFVLEVRAVRRLREWNVHHRCVQSLFEVRSEGDRPTLTNEERLLAPLAFYGASSSAANVTLRIAEPPIAPALLELAKGRGGNIQL